MEKELLEQFTKELKRLQFQVSSLLMREQNYLRDFNPLTESRDEGDYGKATIDRQMEVLSRDALLQIAGMINQSLKNINNGSYGICEICKKEIPVGRLQALPYTPHCVECQAKIEKQGTK
ncbi:MAG: TraR/DksA family transcriptional regulator [Candidatus Atribacteria bacterium]|nr:TraR/DksA family transcriptional regulator [Candidatus Atribacteria bacterium]